MTKLKYVIPILAGLTFCFNPSYVDANPCQKYSEKHDELTSKIKERPMNEAFSDLKTIGKYEKSLYERLSLISERLENSKEQLTCNINNNNINVIRYSELIRNNNIRQFNKDSADTFYLLGLVSSIQLKDDIACDFYNKAVGLDSRNTDYTSALEIYCIHSSKIK